ncbi:MAG TPA: molybdate ABC transporter substrate-binding protein [Bryobacteraceae bacterium]|nr:molybdate ABC transporter substrate-binding protein [Bryobacteraceae bacterium]
MWTRLIAVLSLALLCGCHSEQTPAKPELTVAAAANLTDVFGRIGKRFEADTGIHPVFSFASTAQLTQQIENDAPYDVFCAADSEHIATLEQKGLLAAGSRAIYARGMLALWIPDGSKAAVQRMEDLTLPTVRVIAIAKPELAPYGQASVDSLEKLNIWEQVKSKVVYAENISMAKQYGKSKNADAVFTAYSLVLRESGKVIQVNEALHKPIDQELGIVAKSSRQGDAKKFVTFLISGAGKVILQGYGYQAPAR